MNNTLEGKTAIVTGASSGIGLAMMRALCSRGCRVAAVARNEAKLVQATQEFGDLAIALPTDISDRAAIDGMVKATVDHFGGIDILFANAGVFSKRDFADIEPDVIDDLVGTNIRGVMHCAHAALPHLRKNGASDILVIGSISGVAELPDQAEYAATKHAVKSFTHILRRQLRNEGIRVGLISPGTVATPLWGDTTKAEINGQVARHEVLRAEDVVTSAMFMLEQPRHVAVRDIVILPNGQDL